MNEDEKKIHFGEAFDLATVDAISRKIQVESSARIAERQKILAQRNSVLRPPKPELTLPDEVAKFVKGIYSTPKSIVEYGSGGSTILAAEQSGTTVFSTESDRDWCKKMEDWFHHNPPKGKVFMTHVDIGQTKEWGHPVDNSKILHFINYPMSIWQHPALIHPDVVLIDGRFRVACFVATLMHINRPTTILFDDYSDRPRYHVVEEFCKPTRHVGRMAIFEAEPAVLTASQWHRFGAYFFNPE